jgi:hypothetical protein
MANGQCSFRAADSLFESEYGQAKDKLPPGMIVRPIYIRDYPNGLHDIEGQRNRRVPGHRTGSRA